jgi:hypothetical protein
VFGHLLKGYEVLHAIGELECVANPANPKEVSKPIEDVVMRKIYLSDADGNAIQGEKPTRTTKTRTHPVEYEQIGRNGVNVLVYTASTDSASLWAIGQAYRMQGESMVSFFDSKISGSVDDYLLSDHWWAHYFYYTKTGKEELSITGHGRKTWGQPKTTMPKVVKK